MTITIKRFRMSLFWSSYFPTLLDEAVPVGAPLAKLGRIQSYAEIFDTLLASPNKPITPQASGAPALELPWPLDRPNMFWCRYLNANPIKNLSGRFAFVRLVPLRRHLSLAPGLCVMLPQKWASAGKVLSVGVLGEACFHPHMVTFAIHFTVDGEMTPEKMSELCIELRRSRVLSVPGDSALYKLDEIAVKYLGALFQEAVGSENPRPLPPVNPFSVVTVLQGDNADVQPIDERGNIHRMLEAVTQWDTGKVGSLDAGRISSRLHTLDRPLLFGHTRSRAVWDPQRFSTTGGTSLSCYHRNLFVGTMQTEALLSFAQVAEDEVAIGKRPRSIRDCEDPAWVRTTALHKGDVATYRSASLRRFIDDHPFRPSVDRLAQRLGRNVMLPQLGVPR